MLDSDTNWTSPALPRPRDKITTWSAFDRYPVRIYSTLPPGFPRSQDECREREALQ